jgi:hypothetical protein
MEGSHMASRPVYDLNSQDTEGMSYLHHLFANFSRHPDMKAARVFKLMLSQTNSKDGLPVKPLLLN